ncbi:MAG: YidC/Oxa1 family membrane protein insertase [bacterium]
MFSTFFHEVFYRPLLNLLIWLYNVIPGHDMGIAIIALTAIIRLALYPMFKKTIESQKALTRLQPQVEAIRKAHKDNPEQLNRETMALYSKEKVNPLSSCLPLLIQLPIFAALYRALSDGLKSEGMAGLYNFVSNPGRVHDLFLGSVSLSSPSPFFAILAAVLQFVAGKQMNAMRPPVALRKEDGAKDEDMAVIMNKQMTYMMPIVVIFISWKLPAGLTLYWVVSTIAQIILQYFAFKDIPKTVIHTDPVVPPQNQISNKI